MALYFTYELIIHLIFFQAALLLIVVSNIWIMNRSRKTDSLEDFPLVSILVPARDEERNIAICVQSLLNQDYPAFEILVLDDQSSDRTFSILDEISQANQKLRVFSGKPTPNGVQGKNWACSQLAGQAKGELLFFTDADTQFSADALRRAVATMLGEEADLLTGYPRQVMGTWGERFLVPFFTWAMLTFNSLWLAYILKVPALSSAVGQMMLFKREAYFKIGGHEGIGESVVDDLSLARGIIAGGFCWRVTYIADIISCRMYQNGQEARQGFSKNLFAVFDFRIIPFVFVFSWLVILFWWPLILLLANILGKAPFSNPSHIYVCIIFSILLWGIQYANVKINILLAFLYPLTILVITVTAFQSLYYSLSGKLVWKGRQLARANWKWI